MYEDSNFRLKSKLYKYAIPSIDAVPFNYCKTPIEPYTFGVLIGDATFRHTSLELTQSLEDLKEIKEFIPYKISSIDNSGIHYRV